MSDRGLTLGTADGDRLRRWLLHTILQALFGADPHERTDERTTYRNGTRHKTVATAAGDVTIKIPKSEVSRIRADLDADVTAFNTRDLGEQALPYVFLD